MAKRADYSETNGQKTDMGTTLVELARLENRHTNNPLKYGLLDRRQHFHFHSAVGASI